MPPFVFTDATILAVAEVVKSLCEVQKLTIENMTPEQKEVQSRFFTELMKPGLLVMEGFNKWLEKQLAK